MKTLESHVLRKRACVVRRGAGGKGLSQYLACGLPDFACFCETREDAQQVQAILRDWLKERGLTLSPEKTKIVRLAEGFNFLGFNIRHYQAPLTSRTGWKVLSSMFALLERG